MVSRPSCWDLDSLRAELPLFAEICDWVAERYPDAPPKLQFNETQKRVLDRLVTDLLENSLAAIHRAGVSSVEEVPASAEPPHRLQSSGCETEPCSPGVSFSPSLLSSRVGFRKEQGAHVVESLFRFYLDHPEKLPPTYAEQARQGLRHQIVCDYIAGMTDHYVRRLHRELLG